MTNDKHRKNAIRAEAEHRGLAYQQVFEEHWRPGDETKLRPLLVEAIQQVIAKWPASVPPNGGAIDQLVDDLLNVAIEKPRANAARYWLSAPLGEGDGRWKTSRCMRVVSHFVCDRVDLLDAQKERTAKLTLAVAPIVVRRCVGSAIAKDAAHVAEETELWLSDDAENEWMPEMGD